MLTVERVVALQYSKRTSRPAAGSTHRRGYRSGSHGARIEDIVVCGADGPIPLNKRPHDLQVIE